MKCVAVLFIAVIAVLQSSKVVSLRRTPADGRDKVPLDYLVKIREDIADQEGSPKDLDTAPSIFYYLQDKGE